MLLADRQARVFTAPSPSSSEYHEVFACALGHRSYELPTVALYEGLADSPCFDGCPPPRGRVALGGAMVAYARTVEPETKYVNCFCGEWRVIVRNLRTGRIVHRAPTGPLNTTTPTGPTYGGVGPTYDVPEPGDYIGVGPAVDIVVRRNGSVAWIAHNYGLDQQAAGYEVHVLDRLGSRVLAASPRIDPASLALAGDTLNWTERGTQMSSRID